MNNYILELKKHINIIKKAGWMPCSLKSYGSTGLNLEKLLKINTNNFEIPDYNGIEIKTKKSNIKTAITLFSAAPDSYLFEIKRLHDLYAYPYKNNPKFRVLNKTITQGKLTYIYNNIYFTLKVNKQKKIISLIILDSKLEIIDLNTYWNFDILKEKLERKLRYLCYIHADTFYSNSQLYIKYNNDNYYKLKGFDKFIELIEKGKISITFRIGIFNSGIKKGQIHDHGTIFSIDESDIEELFYKIY